MQKIIFLRTAWMEYYEGVTPDDIPKGAGSYVATHKTGGEVYNFRNENGIYYGYCRNAGGRNFNINRLGAKKEADYLDGVTVVFFATNPMTGGQFVVGWYTDAILYRSYQEKKMNTGLRHYICETKETDGYLLDNSFRVLEMPDKKDGGPGQTNLWYLDNYYKKESFYKRLITFMKDPEAFTIRMRKGAPRQPNVEKRTKVEKAAMDETTKYWVARGFDIKDVHLENVGWDLEAVNRVTNKKFLLEVKGLSGVLQTIELTPNEYKHSTKPNYRLCILPNALDINKELFVFEFNKGLEKWTSDKAISLKINERIGARLYRL